MASLAIPRPRQLTNDALFATPAVLAAVAEALDTGIVLAIGGRIVLANQAMATMIGLPVATMMRMTPHDLAAFVAEQVDAAPEVVRDGGLFPHDASVLCEEFEIVRPLRSVVRWVTRRLDLPQGRALLATCTDIT